MTQNRNNQFLNSEPQLAYYAKTLKQSITTITSKIHQEKIKARQLMFNVSALFGIPVTRNKIEEQLTKMSIVDPVEFISNPQIDDIVLNVTKTHMNDISTKININNQVKRAASTGDNREGPQPKKKRKVQGQKKIDYRKSFVKEINPNSQQGLEKQPNQKNNEQAENVQSSNSLKNPNAGQDSEFSKP